MTDARTQNDAAAPAVLLEHVTHRFGDIAALQDISLRVDAGERLGVLGPNGGGKTTLVRILCGLLRPASGRVEILGRSPAEAARTGLVGFVPQRAATESRLPLHGREIVLQPLTCDLAPWRRVPRNLRDRVDETIELVGAGGYADRPFADLSGGQMQRLLIARAVACRPALLLLDEPTTGIDVAGQRRFADLIQKLSEELGLAVVTVSHELRTVASTSDRVACLSRTLHFHDAPRGLTPQVLSELFQHDVEAVLGEPHAHTHDHADGRGGDA